MGVLTMRKMGQSEIIDVPELVSENKERWININLTEVNDSIVRLGIFEGEFHWHKHNLEDELFFVLDGRLLLDFEGKTLELTPHQGYTISAETVHLSAVALDIRRLGLKKYTPEGGCHGIPFRPQQFQCPGFGKQPSILPEGARIAGDAAD